VYQTTPGAYQRTQEYLRGFRTSSRATRYTVSVTVWNDADYAVYVEAGRDGMSIAMLEQLAALRPDPSQPLYLGRSGRDWTRPGPAVIPAAFYAASRLRDLHRQAVRDAMR